ncbi:head GIN domain-containing protein [Pedobacter sp. JCM 36344]|uniref:head GIN domain-containing protein n=1 Tax=Pedobacter sp. JCM 36344 TaxID=3374280 RepID=UPI00397C093C
MKRTFSILFTSAFITANFSAYASKPIVNDVAVYASTGNNNSKSGQDRRDVKNFNGLAAGGPIEVIITIGNSEGLKFEGDAEAISTLVTEVKGNILIIRPKTSWTSWSHKYENQKIIARVSAKTITSLTMSGNGSIKVNGTIHAAELAISLSGSGSINANVDADKLTSVLSGSGSVNLTGKTEDANVTVSGSGKFSGKTLSMNNLNTRISGSGSVNVKVEDNIKALVSGSGRVNYSGNPNVEQRVIGSGGVSKI